MIVSVECNLCPWYLQVSQPWQKVQTSQQAVRLKKDKAEVRDKLSQPTAV